MALQCLKITTLHITTVVASAKTCIDAVTMSTEVGIGTVESKVEACRRVGGIIERMGVRCNGKIGGSYAKMLWRKEDGGQLC